MKRGFTLVELLIVVAIIGILASITLMALSQAQGQAKIYRTQTTIAKINDALTEVYERYEYSAAKWDAPSGVSQLLIDRINYLLKRDAMQFEMPQTADEVDFASASRASDIAAPLPTTPATLQAGVIAAAADASTAADVYREATTAPWAMTTHTADTVSAELLYLIIETNNPESLAGFKGSDIGDTDSDGLFEFLDAWGNPIRFLRYAPGLQEGVLRVPIQGGTVETTRLGQPVISVTELEEYATSDELSAYMQSITDVSAFRDPLYPQQGDETDQLLKCQWVTFPLIYSCGADKEPGIVDAVTPVNGIADILPISQVNILLGAPLPVGDPNYGSHADNITNHNMTRPF